MTPDNGYLSRELSSGRYPHNFYSGEDSMSPTRLLSRAIAAATMRPSLSLKGSEAPPSTASNSSSKDSDPVFELITPECPVVTPNRMYQRAAERIRNLIVRSLSPGDKLPPTRDLAEMFRLSPSSIRGGVRALEILGLVEPRQGAGTFVREVTGDTPIESLTASIRRQPIDVAGLLDFCKVLEPGLAGRAATHASADQIVNLEEILHRQWGVMRDGDITLPGDYEFHYALALASGNVVIQEMLDVLSNLLQQTHAHFLNVGGRSIRSLASHRRILTAIKKHDRAAAEASMAQHIEEIEATILETAISESRDVANRIRARGAAEELKASPCLMVEAIAAGNKKRLGLPQFPTGLSTGRRREIH